MPNRTTAPLRLPASLSTILRQVPAEKKEVVSRLLLRRLLLTLAFAGLVAGCRSTPSIDQRLRNHFQMAEIKEITPDTVRQNLLTRLPPGTSEPQIYEFLKHSGIGQDQFSAFYPVDDDHRIFCHIDSDPATYNPFGAKHKGYAIYFVLDYRNQLHDIRVQSWPSEYMARPSEVPGVVSGGSPAAAQATGMGSAPAGSGGMMRK